MDEAEGQQKRPGSMTTNQLMSGIQEHQQQINLFLEQLSLRSSLQGYTEQQQDELLTLIQKALTYIEEVPVGPEWIDRRNELIVKIREKL